MRRHLTSATLCEICNQAEESALHVCRDCPKAAEIWRRLVPGPAQNEFFSLNLEQWLASNLLLPSLVGRDNWACSFGVIVWKLWRWRNESLFMGKYRDVDRGLHEISIYIEGLERVTEGARKLGRRTGQEHLIGVVAFATSLDDVPGVHLGLVSGIKDLLSRQSKVKVKHVFREANYAVDFLASFAAEGPLGYRSFDAPPEGIRQ
ncbi:Polynucleotidyl transferase- ribonuclease H-like superfamily protein [Striga hermonthica]|uniref:Polynucleotidyl transferase- ribonuclease H-like superfamily protein n=1 Tax=Striga hermonthica TaxID=68872 RepID=A0A9N7R560_STRHE|nr:Polynucleotidyl transferase- ribonuclease H-like superfamily protein [Striga hermonthica]